MTMYENRHVELRKIKIKENKKIKTNNKNYKLLHSDRNLLHIYINFNTFNEVCSFSSIGSSCHNLGIQQCRASVSVAVSTQPYQPAFLVFTRATLC